MARRSSKLLRFENSLYKYNSESQTWTIENVDLNQTSKQIDISEKGTYASCKRMSQKVNPVSLRKGFLDSWNSTQYINYKESNLIKNSFYFELFIRNYIESILQNHYSFLDKIEFKEIGGIIYLNIFLYVSKNITKKNTEIQPHLIKRYKSLLKDSDDILNINEKETSYNPFFIENNNNDSKFKSYSIDTLKLTNHLEKYLTLFFDNEIKVSFHEHNDIANSSILLSNFLSNEIEKSNANFKRALRETFKEIKDKSKIKGIRINCSGRLGKAPMAKTEWFKYGQIPLSKINARLEYSNSTAVTKYGSIGVKVWVYYHD
jgi:ribosomal protein S3